MDPATVTIQLEPGDMQNFSQFVAARTKRRILAIFVVAVVIFIVFNVVRSTFVPPPRPAVVPTHQGPPAPPTFGWVPIVLGLGGIVAGKIWIRWLTGRQSLYKKTTPAAFDPRTYTVLDKGLRCQYELGESMEHWPAIVRFTETPDYFFIMVAERRGHILPKRCFATSEDAAIFANQVRQHLAMQAPKALAGAAR